LEAGTISVSWLLRLAWLPHLEEVIIFALGSLSAFPDRCLSSEKRVRAELALSLVRELLQGEDDVLRHRLTPGMDCLAELPGGIEFEAMARKACADAAHFIRDMLFRRVPALEESD
jgi:hypothetical protein